VRLCVALLCISRVALAADSSASGAGKLLTGKAVMGDWTSDAPAVHRKITVSDLSPP